MRVPGASHRRWSRFALGAITALVVALPTLAFGEGIGGSGIENGEPSDTPPSGPLRPPTEAENAGILDPETASEESATPSEVADSEDAYSDESAPEARGLLLQEFAGLIDTFDQQPGRAFDGAHVEKFLSDSVARIDPPGSEGPSLAISSTPLRDHTEEGATKAVDLDVQREEGHFEARNPLVDVSLPADAASPLRLDAANVGVRLASDGAAQAPGVPLQGDKVFYHEAAPDTDLVLAPVTRGVEIMTQVRSADSPERLPFRVDLPAGAELHDRGERGLEVAIGDQVLTVIGSLVAVDAQGNPIETGFEQTGPNSFDLTVEHQSEDALYPILVDPLVEDWYYNNWAWQGNGNFNGWGDTYAGGGDYYVTTRWCRYYCWGQTFYPHTVPLGLYVSADQGWQFPSGAARVWYYNAPGQTSFITNATFSPIYFARGGDWNWYTPFAYWGVCCDPGGHWAGYGSTGQDLYDASQTWNFAPPPSGPGARTVYFGMGNNYPRGPAYGNPYAALGANLTAGLGGMYMQIDDPEPPSLSDPVPANGAPSFSSWLPEANGTSTYRDLVNGENPLLHWRLGEPAGSTSAADSSGNSRGGTYVGAPATNVKGAVAEGLNQGGAVDLNGTGQHVSSAYSARRNLPTNPSVEAAGTTGYGPWGPASVARDTTQSQHGSSSLKVTAAQSGYGTVAGSPTGWMPVTAGKHYSAAAQFKGGGSGGIGLKILWANSSFGWLRADPVTVNATGGWTRAVLNGSNFGPAPAGAAWALLLGLNQSSTAQDFSMDAVQFEEGQTIGSYFDGSSRGAKWEATSNGSVSAEGPFLNGTTRTFEGWARRDTENTLDMLFSGTRSDSGAPYFYLGGEFGIPANTVAFAPSGNNGGSLIRWDDAWPGVGQWAHWALVFDEAADTVELFINGESMGVRTSTTPYSTPAGTFNAGTWQAAGGAYGGFDGKLDEVAVYDHALTAAQLRDHYRRASSGIGWVEATATDPGVGIQSLKLTYPKNGGGEHIQPDPTISCHGTWSRGACHPLVKTEFPFNTSDANGALLPQGISTLTLETKDALGKTTSKTFDAKVDRSIPAMQVSGGLYSAQPGYDLHVSATDGSATSLSASERPNARSGMRRIDLYMDRATNPNPIATTGNRPCTQAWGSCPLALDHTLNPQSYPEGDHEFEVVATDQLGHENSPRKIWNESVDRTPPAVDSISGSATSGWLTGGTASVAVSASDSGNGVERVELDVPLANGQTETVEHLYNCNPRCPRQPDEATFTLAVGQLAEGVQAIAARAYGPGESAGPIQTAEIKVDRTPASVQVEGPDGWLAEGTSTITVDAENPAAGVDHLTLELPGGQLLTENLTCEPNCPEQVSHEFEFDVEELPNGAIDAIVRAYGPGGVPGGKVGQIKVDHSAPELTGSGILFSAVGQLSGATPETVADVHDEGSGLSSLSIWIDGEEMDTRTLAEFEETPQTCQGASCAFHGEYLVDLSAIDSGDHEVELAATDLAGNVDSVTNEIRLDSAPPTLEVAGELADRDGKSLVSETTTASATVEDAIDNDSGVESLTVQVDDQDDETYPSACAPECPDSVQHPYQYVKTDWGAGRHLVTFTAKDVAGNETDRSIETDVRPLQDVTDACPSEQPMVADVVDPLSPEAVTTAVIAQANSPLAATAPTTDPETSVEIDPVLVPTVGDSPADPNVIVEGSLVPEGTSSAPGGAFTIGTAVCLQPALTTPAASPAFLPDAEGTASEAAVYANSGPQMDTIYRPTPLGAALVYNLRGGEAPQMFKWHVGLASGQQIEELSTGGLAIVDTTAPDPSDNCEVPPAPLDGESLASLPDTATQLAQSEHELCLAENEIDDGRVEAVIAPPIAVEEAGNPVPVTLELIEMPGAEPWVVVEWPADQLGPPEPDEHLYMRGSARRLLKPPPPVCHRYEQDVKQSGLRMSSRVSWACFGAITSIQGEAWLRRLTDRGFEKLASPPARDLGVRKLILTPISDPCQPTPGVVHYYEMIYHITTYAPGGPHKTIVLRQGQNKFAEVKCATVVGS